MGDSDSQILSLADLIREIRQDQREDSKTLQKILIDLGKMQTEQEAQRQRIESITTELQQVDGLTKVQDNFDMRLMAHDHRLEALDKKEEQRTLAAADMKKRAIDLAVKLSPWVFSAVLYYLGWIDKPPAS